MDTLDALSGKLATIDDIRSIVRTMKALSAASIRRYEQAEQAVSGYAATVDLGLAALLQDRRARGLLRPATAPSSPKEACIVIGSDRGLCGRYNEVAARAAQQTIGAETALLAVVGARAGARLQDAGHRVDPLYPVPGTAAGIGALVQDMIVAIEHWTRAAGIGRVRIVHNRREGRASAVPVDRVLLPIPHRDLAAMLEGGWPGAGVPFFRMRAEDLLSGLLRQRFFVVLYRALAEALASEHATRLAAMQTAERSIDQRRDDLEALYRQSRQAAITRELMDLVSGFEAVNAAPSPDSDSIDRAADP